MPKPTARLMRKLLDKPMAGPSSKSTRTPRKLTQRRMGLIKEFLKVVHQNPKKYGEIGSKPWVTGLIGALKERQRNAIIDSDVTLWLKKQPEFFRDTIRTIRKRAKLSPTAPTSPRSTSSSSSADTIPIPTSFDSDSDSDFGAQDDSPRNDCCTKDVSPRNGGSLPQKSLKTEKDVSPRRPIGVFNAKEMASRVGRNAKKFSPRGGNGAKDVFPRGGCGAKGSSPRSGGSPQQKELKTETTNAVALLPPPPPLRQPALVAVDQEMEGEQELVPESFDEFNPCISDVRSLMPPADQSTEEGNEATAVVIFPTITMHDGGYVELSGWYTPEMLTSVVRFLQDRRYLPSPIVSTDTQCLETVDMDCPFDNPSNDGSSTPTRQGPNVVIPYISNVNAQTLLNGARMLSASLQRIVEQGGNNGSVDWPICNQILTALDGLVNRRA